MFGIYVHWPFCAFKCPYCDFNSHVREKIDQAAWREAYAREIETIAAKTKGRIVTSIFFGGGTPSLMEPQTAQSIIAAIRKNWQTSNDCEITLEANPTSVEAEKFEEFRGAGIDRVSIGVQALNDKDLKFLGRQHSAEEARKAVETASRYFDRYSFDLIYARPEQRLEAWEDELSQALEMAGGHLSLYQLTIEKGTPFYTRHKRGEFEIPDEDLAGAMYELTQDKMAGAGMPAYEISNHAAAAQESRHNLTYWHYDDYAGIGPGAHGRLTLDNVKYATRAHAAPEIWLERVNKDGHGHHPYEEVTREQRFQETLMMGLRLREGVRVEKLEDEGGKAFESLISAARLNALVNEGYLERTNERLVATAAGRQRLNGLLGYLLAPDNEQSHK